MAEPMCPHCDQEIAIRNPSGYCDHLYYPRECPVCSAREHRPDQRIVDADTLADAVQVFMWTEEQWAAEQSGFTAQHRQEARNAMKAAWRRYYETHLKGAAAPESNEATS